MLVFPLFVHLFYLNQVDLNQGLTDDGEFDSKSIQHVKNLTSQLFIQLLD